MTRRASASSPEIDRHGARLDALESRVAELAVTVAEGFATVRGVLWTVGCLWAVIVLAVGVWLGLHRAPVEAGGNAGATISTERHEAPRLAPAPASSVSRDLGPVL